MSTLKATGLIIKQTEFGESNRMITVFTKEYGIITASVYGVKSMKRSKANVCRFLSYAEFDLVKASSDVYRVVEATQLEGFFELTEDFVKLSLAVYLCDITYSAIGKQNTDEQILSLLLNTLYLMCYKNLSSEKAKMVYELRLMAMAGYKPVLKRCVKCDSADIVGFSVQFSGAVCKNCSGKSEFSGKTVLEALNYIVEADNKRMFSFEVSDELMKKLSLISEEYVQKHLEQHFQSLVYYKNIL